MRTNKTHVNVPYTLPDTLLSLIFHIPLPDTVLSLTDSVRVRRLGCADLLISQKWAEFGHPLNQLLIRVDTTEVCVIRPTHDINVCGPD